MIVVRLASLLAVTAVLCSSPAFAITFGQTDDFQGSTDPLGWAEGAPSPNPPFVVLDGGPGGTGDSFLQANSSGFAAVPGGRQVVFNRAQWLGDYVAAGVTQVSMMVANLGSTDLYVRIGVQGGSSRFASTNAVVLTPGSGWQALSFPISDAAMTREFGADDLADALLNVTEFRVNSSQFGGWRGDVVASSMGIDDITAGSDPTPAPAIVDFAVDVSPNPVVNQALFSFRLPATADVELRVFDTRGRLVETILQSTRPAGLNSASWNPRGQSAGTYFYQLRAGTRVSRGKLIVVD